MYNRYIPQPDGSFKRNRIPENLPHQRPPQPQTEPTPVAETPCLEQPEHTPQPTPPPGRKPRQRQPQCNSDSITGFFRQLLPKDLDTGDLMIILLFLLMAGDCEEDRNNALLTLALYFLM